MEIKIRKLVGLISSGWLFISLVLLFIAETGWLALTSRFPMAFDEGYHFGLIQYYSHHLNPIITSQSASTYKFGAIIQDPSFLYHYLMSFPYRFLTLFTKSFEVQVVGLRLINIALAVATLLIIRKILRQLHVSDGLSNVLIIIFALTPLVTVLSAQINYDNLLNLAVTVSVYWTLQFIQGLSRKVFDTKKLLSLLCLCLFSSLVKYSFLPIFLAIILLLIWKVVSYSRLPKSNLVADAKKSFRAVGKYSRLLLFTATLLGSLLFIRYYAVNLVKYHNPAPQCNQILSVQDCRHYYAWNNNYLNLQYKNKHPKVVEMNTLQYGAYWSSLLTFELYGETMPLQGLSYVSLIFTMIIGLTGGIAFICTVVNFKKLFSDNQGLLIITIISLVYVFFLWARNYHDYLQLGIPTAINARYLIPILIYLYILLGSGLQIALSGRNIKALAAKTSLALVLLCTLIFYGGFTQYILHISPVYGHLSPTNSYIFESSY